jgi:hypothetical protein
MIAAKICDSIFSAFVDINAVCSIASVANVTAAGEARRSVYAGRTTNVCAAVVRVVSTLVIVDAGISSPIVNKCVS